jgi:hypothetical protein
LAKATRKSVEADDLAGRAHLRAEQDIDAGEAGEREDRFLDGDMVELARIRLLAIEGGELFTGHDAGGDLGDRRADGLGDEGHGARGARIDFEHVDVAVLDGDTARSSGRRPSRPSAIALVWRSSSSIISSTASSGGSEQALSRRSECRLPRYAP